MHETYTIESQMVQFLYHELSGPEAIEVTQLIEEDTEVGDLYASLFFAKAQLPKALFNPAPNTVTNILQYSRLNVANH
jgi:hypothetical protein